MKKNKRLTEWLKDWDPTPTHALPVEYRAFVEEFNRGAYYEAHDVLEHLWLRTSDDNRSFYQALIQLAGAFVHFQKHALFPSHPTHSRRLAPGRRLLALAMERLKGYPKIHLCLNLEETIALCLLWSARALDNCGQSPLKKHSPPRLTLSPN